MHQDPVPELKRQLGAELRAALGRFPDRRADVAVLLDTDPARISDLRHGRLERFSLETLVRFAARVCLRVELRVSRWPTEVQGNQADPNDKGLRQRGRGGPDARPWQY